MTNWTAADLPDLTGKTVVITGGTGGIGLITTRELARAGARVVMGARDPAKGEAVARGLTGTVEVRRLDVASQASIRAFADGWDGGIDVLINNAGIMRVPYARTVDGFESQAATNLFGPFTLTNLLLPQVRGRVVTISSQLHRMGQLHADDLDWTKRRYNDQRAYADSKLDVTLFALELDRRLAASGSQMRSMVAHPGIAATGLVDHVGGLTTWAMGALRWLYNDAERGALPTLYAATQDIPGGSYVGPDGLASIKGYPKVREPSKAARDERNARELWDVAARLTGVGAAPRAAN